MNKVVEQILKKELFKRGGVIASREAVQAAYDGLEARMKNLGLDINLIKTERDYEQALGFVKSLEDQIFKKNLDDFITQKPPAKVFDLEGRQLDTQKPIIGGTQDQDEILQKSIKKNIDEATKKGDFRGIANQVLRDPEILKEFKKMKEIEALADERALQKKLIPLDTIQYQTKEIQKMTGPEKQKYLITDDKQTAELLKRGYTFDDIIYAQDNYGLTAKEIMEEAKGATKKDPFPFETGGRVGFTGGGIAKELAKQIIKKYKGKIDDKLLNQMLVDDNPQRLAEVMATIDEALIMQNKGMGPNEIVGTIKSSLDRKKQATGGRAGFKVGSPSKRAFLKVMGGLAATIAAIKSGLVGTSGKEATKQVIKESAKDVSKAPPQYFFDLANKIKLLGKESKVKPQERVNEYNYKGKDGSDYTLTEDISTGDMQITKDKTGIGVADDKTFDTIEDRTVMNFKKGRGDETTKGTPTDEYDEFKVDFDVDGTPADADDISEIIKKEIIEEASDMPQQKIKRASGGVASMLGE